MLRLFFLIISTILSICGILRSYDLRSFYTQTIFGGIPSLTSMSRIIPRSCCYLFACLFSSYYVLYAILPVMIHFYVHGVSLR